MATQFLRDLSERRAAMEQYLDRLTPSIRGFFQNFPNGPQNNSENGDNINNQKDLNAYYEWLLVETQKLFFWTNPLRSGISFVIFSLVYLRFFLFCRIGFVAVCCTTAFAYTFAKLWFLYIWPAIRVEPPADRDSDRWAMVDENVYSLEELKTMFQSFKSNAREFFDLLLEIRAHAPAVFYSSSICLFAGLFYLTVLVPSSMLVYIILAKSFLLSGLLVRVISWDFVQQLGDLIVSTLRSTLPPSSPLSHSRLASDSISQEQASSSAQERITSFLKESLEKTDNIIKTLKLRSDSQSSSDVVVESSPAVAAPAVATTERVPAVHSEVETSRAVPVCELALTSGELDTGSSKSEHEDFQDSTEVGAQSKPTSESEPSSSLLPSVLDTNEERKNDDDVEEEEEECLVKSNYCENFFTIDRQPRQSLQQEEETPDEQPAGAKPEVTPKPAEDLVGDDFEIISDSEIESFATSHHSSSSSSKRHF